MIIKIKKNVKRPHFLLSLISFLLSLTFIGCASMLGRVREPSGRPVPDAQITIYENENIVETTKTTETGEYKTPPLPPKRTYRIEISKDSYETRKTEIFIEKKESLNIDFVLNPYTIPKEVASIEPEKPKEEEELFKPADEELFKPADESPKPEIVKKEVKKEIPKRPASTTIKKEVKVDKMAMIKKEKGYIYGEIKDINGLPIFSAVVKVFKKNKEITRSYTNSKGLYIIKIDFPPSEYLLKIWVSGYLPVARPVRVKPKINLVADFTLRKK